MGWLGLCTAIAAAVCVALPGPAMYAAMGLAVAAIGLGAVAYRRREAGGRARLLGAGAITLGTLALVLAAARYGLTLAAIARLRELL